MLTTALQPTITSIETPMLGQDELQTSEQGLLSSFESDIAYGKPLIKRYLFASDFDKTLTFNDTGYAAAVR